MAVEWSNGYAGDIQAESVARARTATRGGGSLIMQLAAVLGSIADKFVERVLAKANQLDAASSNKGGKSSENKLTAEMQGLTQIMKMFQEAMNTVIKTMGDGNSSVARRQ